MRFRLTPKGIPGKGQTWMVSFTDPDWGPSSIYTGLARVIGPSHNRYTNPVSGKEELTFSIHRLDGNSRVVWGEWMPLSSFKHAI